MTSMWDAREVFAAGGTTTGEAVASGALATAVFALIGTILTAMIMYRTAVITLKSSRRAQIADDARKQLVAGGDALESLHWTLHEACKFITDHGQAIWSDADIQEWREVIDKVERTRDKASIHGTRIAIDFGCESAVRMAYDEHQKYYRRLAERLLTGHYSSAPPAVNEAAEISNQLGRKEWASTYINTASEAARAREEGQPPPAGA
jgi:hypothetical protein